MAKRPRIKKVIDDRFAVRCALGKGTIRYEVWQDAAGKVIRYNLAFIYPNCTRGAMEECSGTIQLTGMLIATTSARRSPSR
jgi:hypothetical protein